MALETGTYLDDLVPANPASTDGLAQADDHLRLIKSTLKNTFPNITGPVTVTQAELNSTPSTLTDLGITDGTASQVLQTDGSGNFTFVTPTDTDTNNYVTGGSISGSTMTLTRSGLSDLSILGLPPTVTNNNQLTNGAGYITASTPPVFPTVNGAVGTYVTAMYHGNAGVAHSAIFVSYGVSFPGSSLTVASTANTIVQGTAGESYSGGASGTLTGTWKAMCRGTAINHRFPTGSFLRIA